MNTRIVGLGNDLLSDDGVGLEVVRELRCRLGHRGDLEFRESAVGGMRLLDDLLGGDRVVLVDALLAPNQSTGCVSIWRWEPSDSSFRCYDVSGRDTGGPVFCPARRYSSTHDTDLASALALARELGMPLPKRIWLFAVAIGDATTFHEGVCREVAAGRDKLIALLERALVADAASPAVGHAVAS